MTPCSCASTTRWPSTITHTGVDVLQVTTHERTRVRVGLPRLVRTRIALTATGDVEVEGETVAAHRLPSADGRTRVALVAPSATDDHDGRVEVDVAAGRALEIVEVTGSGTHDVEHVRAQWLVDLRLGRDAVLVWPSLPIVVAAGADVMRLMHADLAPGARVVLRETLVVRSPGREGGRVRSTIRARLDDRPLLAETFVVEPSLPVVGTLDAVLGPAPPLPGPSGATLPGPRPSSGDEQRLDTLLVLGARLGHPEALQLEREGSMLRGPAARTHDDDLGHLVGAAVVTPVDAGDGPAPEAA